MREGLLSALQHKPVFTVREIASTLGISREYSYLVAYRLKVRGIIKEIEKGKYSTVSDPLLVASWITWPSYISSWAALSFYKLTEQLPFTIHIITTRKRKRKTLFFEGAKLEFIKVRPVAFFGFNRLVYQGRDIFIAEKEKAIIDAVLYKKMSFEEAIELVHSNKGKIKKAKLLDFARVSPKLKAKLKAGLK